MPKLRDTFVPVGGVSQEPTDLRDETRVAAVEQAVSDPYLGLVKRPPIEYSASLPAGLTTALAAPEGKVAIYERPNGDKYWIVVTDGAITAYNYDTGASVTLEDDSGTYLDGGTDFELLQVGNDEMWVVNKDTTVARTDDTTALRTPEALIYIREADFATYYKVTVDGVTVNYNTPKAEAPEQRFDVGTDQIAASIRTQLAADLGTTDWTFTRYGSTIVVQRVDGNDFTITGEDGLADRGMIIVKDKVQRFEDLPLRCKEGFTVEVTGDPGVDEDNYWVKFTPEHEVAEDDLGTWVEVAKPGTFYKLDPDTMPHILEFQRPLVQELEAGAVGSTPLAPLGTPTRETLTGTAWTLSGGTPLDVIATEHLEYLENTIAATSADGDFTVYWCLDTSAMTTGTAARVEVIVDGSTEYSIEYSKRDALYFGQTTVSITTGVSGSTVRLRLFYVDETTPGIGNRAQLYAGGSPSYPGPDDDDAFFDYGAPRTVVFTPGAIYPGGWEVQLQIGVDTFTYTVSGATEDADTVAAGLQALVNADADWTATVSGNIVSIVASSDSTAPAIVSLTATYTNTTHVWFPGSSLSANVGDTLRNLTTNSEGTITSVDGETVILSGGMAGGTRATMLDGDQFEIGVAGDYFGFGPGVWDDREAGSLDIVPFPSFLGYPITGLFLHEGRIGILARTNVVLSRSSNYKGWFRKSARVLLDDDPVDITVAGPYAGAFASAFSWSERTFLVNEYGIFLLQGDPFLSPRTVALPFAGRVASTTSVKPQVAGDIAFFLNETPKGVQINAISVGDNLQIRTVSMNRHCPTYITSGSSYAMAVDADFKLLVVSNGTELYFMRWTDDGMVAWSKAYLDISSE